MPSMEKLDTTGVRCSSRIDALSSTRGLEHVRETDAISTSSRIPQRGGKFYCLSVDQALHRVICEGERALLCVLPSHDDRGSPPLGNFSRLLLDSCRLIEILSASSFCILKWMSHSVVLGMLCVGPSELDYDPPRALRYMRGVGVHPDLPQAHTAMPPPG